MDEVTGKIQRFTMDHLPEGPPVWHYGEGHKMQASVSAKNTSARCLILPSGSVSVEITRDGEVIHSQGFGPEEATR